MTTLTPTNFRNLIDSVSSYSELIPYMQLLIDDTISKEYGNSFLHALSLLNSEHIEFEQWLTFYHSLVESFQPEDYDKSTYPSLVRVFCSDFGYQFLNQSSSLEDKITELLQTMGSRSIKLRKRTLSPIIQAVWRENIPHLGMSIFALSQVNHITLDSGDLCCLLESGSMIDRMTLLREILNYPNMFQENDISYLHKSFRCQSFMISPDNKCGDFRIPEFQLSVEEKKQLLITLESHVDEKTTHRKTVRKAFSKFCSSYNKKFTAVVDGANVGRFQQGAKSQGALNFRQICNVVQELSKVGHRVMVCLNENHLKKMDERNHKILQEIKTHSVVIKTPSGLDDDLCWLYASISLPRAFLLTMDELRNHIYTIDSAIQKWKEYRRITFNIDKSSGQVTFKYPLAYEVKPHLQSKEDGKTLWLPIDNRKWYAVEL